MSNADDVQPVDLLARPIYGMSQVDRILHLNAGTARRWIDGYVRSGKHYPPVIREASTGDDIVTWGEFVEARLLAEYRRSGIPMIRMRPTVGRLRELFGEYPLARSRPFVADQELVYQVQNEVGLDKGLYLVVVARSGQMMLAPSAASFANAVDWGVGNDVVRRLHPRGYESPVVVDPLMAFGSPAVRGVRTDALAEQHRAGDPVWFLADIYELPEQDVRAALAFSEAAA